MATIVPEESSAAGAKPAFRSAASTSEIGACDPATVGDYGRVLEISVRCTECDAGRFCSAIFDGDIGTFEAQINASIVAARPGSGSLGYRSDRSVAAE